MFSQTWWTKMLIQNKIVNALLVMCWRRLIRSNQVHLTFASMTVITKMLCQEKWTPYKHVLMAKLILLHSCINCGPQPSQLLHGTLLWSLWHFVTKMCRVHEGMLYYVAIADSEVAIVYNCGFKTSFYPNHGTLQLHIWSLWHFVTKMCK